MKMFFLPLEGCTFLHQNRALKMDDSRTFPVDVSFPLKILEFLSSHVF